MPSIDQTPAKWRPLSTKGVPCRDCTSCTEKMKVKGYGKIVIIMYTIFALPGALWSPRIPSFSPFSTGNASRRVLDRGFTFLSRSYYIRRSTCRSNDRGRPTPRGRTIFLPSPLTHQDNVLNLPSASPLEHPQLTLRPYLNHYRRNGVEIEAKSRLLPRS